MGNFKYKMAQFMMGRNGFDTFSKGLLFASLVFVFADLVVPGDILRTLGSALIIYSYFRAFSKNLTRRYAENSWYVATIQRPFRSYVGRDRKNFRYFKCPSCNQLLRAPKGRGRIRITCSRCHNIFEKKV